MNIAVFGTGYVGLVTGTCFADFGLNVICVDKDEGKIDRLTRGEIPIYEPGLDFLVQKNMREGRLAFTTDPVKAIHASLVIFIAVGTPSDEHGTADLTAIEEVAKVIAHHMDGYKVIATKSTVPAGTGKWVQEIIRREQPKQVAFDVVSNPEFLREGSAIEDFMRPNRIIIGADSDQAVAIMKDIYNPLYLIETPMVVTNVETAEMIKYASNAFLAMKISFINEVAMLCEKVHADVHMVAKGMGLDNRIGNKFLHPGPGYGGSCFPKDVQALSVLARKHDHQLKLVDAVIEVNNRQKRWALDKVLAAMGDPKQVTVALAGLAFKPNTDDLRDSPAMYVAKELLALGVNLRTYDPAGMPAAKSILGEGVTYLNNIYDLVDGSDVLVIATEWNQFRKVEFAEIKRRMKKPIIVDLRNVYDRDVVAKEGFQYTGVGRG